MLSQSAHDCKPVNLQQDGQACVVPCSGEGEVTCPLLAWWQRGGPHPSSSLALSAASFAAAAQRRKAATARGAVHRIWLDYMLCRYGCLLGAALLVLL
jgi:hypothetical protein